MNADTRASQANVFAHRCGAMYQMAT